MAIDELGSDFLLRIFHSFILFLILSFPSLFSLNYKDPKNERKGRVCVCWFTLLFPLLGNDAMEGFLSPPYQLFGYFIIFLMVIFSKISLEIVSFFFSFPFAPWFTPSPKIFHRMLFPTTVASLSPRGRQARKEYRNKYPIASFSGFFFFLLSTSISISFSGSKEYGQTATPGETCTHALEYWWDGMDVGFPCAS